MPLSACNQSNALLAPDVQTTYDRHTGCPGTPARSQSSRSLSSQSHSCSQTHTSCAPSLRDALHLGLMKAVHLVLVAALLFDYTTIQLNVLTVAGQLDFVHLSRNVIHQCLSNGTQALHRFLPSFIRVGWFMNRTFNFKAFTSRVYVRRSSIFSCSDTFNTRSMIFR